MCGEFGRRIPLRLRSVGGAVGVAILGAVANGVIARSGLGEHSPVASAAGQRRPAGGITSPCSVRTHRSPVSRNSARVANR